MMWAIIVVGTLVTIASIAGFFKAMVIDRSVRSAALCLFVPPYALFYLIKTANRQTNRINPRPL